MTKIALCFVSMLAEKYSWICWAHPSAPAWSLLGLQGSTSSGTWSTSVLPATSLGVCQAIYHILFPSLPSALVAFCRFSKMLSQKCHLRGWRVQLWPVAGLFWSWGCPAQGSLGLSSQRPPCSTSHQHLAIDTQYSPWISVLHPCFPFPAPLPLHLPSSVSTAMVVPHSVIAFCYNFSKSWCASSLITCITSFIEEDLVISQVGYYYN